MNDLFLRLLLFVAFSSAVLFASAQHQLPGWAMGPFIRPSNANPILSPDTQSVFFDPMSKQHISWEAGDVFNPAAVVKNNKIYVLYRAEDKSGTGIGKRTSRLGIAESRDGIKMKKRNKPVLYPDEDGQKEFEWPGGCEDPRIAVTKEGVYVMLYTQWNRKVARLAIATSKDLTNWTKHGPVFQKAYNGRFKDMFCKSGSIVTKIENGRQVITKLNGKYVMYWGERFMNLATSDDLVNWDPALNEKKELDLILKPRKHHFDSDMTECGPPAIITDQGILVLYNGKNKGNSERDTNYTANTYAGGQVLFDLNNPSKVIRRLDKPFFIPTEPFEKSGQYPAGTVFMEGLVYFKNKWFLYYGCADSRVGVAIYNPKQ
ncbi:glycoside hydrolase family 130 protein [Haoranjiania flava]|uniref:Glycoside hydrolase family 130 protein n=1 Tax=Haoranjiania flava TaxID=1856322 RepID=A0AAE3ILL0_9BACT|nr:glycoside hydrolase family 130 protein [Haoranjiania flava]MCU7693201.1 glycoside hydrolase family 130 protein [Haoranjiania flava]